MERNGRPSASDVEAWLTQELAFLYTVERRFRRRASLAKRTRWLVAAMLAVGICCSIWTLVGTLGRA